MKTFKIEIQELLTRTIEIQSESLEIALFDVQKQYYEEKIVLDYGDFSEVTFRESKNQTTRDEINLLTKEILQYLYEDEKTNFEEMDEPEDHIFNKLERLKMLIGL